MTVDAARVDVGTYTSRVGVDRNALDLLVGAAVPEALLPRTGRRGRREPPRRRAGRPAVRGAAQAPRRDRRGTSIEGVSYANMGAVRAALSPEHLADRHRWARRAAALSGLFGGGTGIWSFAPSIDIPLFDAGARQANVAATEAQRKIEIATYEATVQAAFRDVADALAERATLADRLAAQDSLVEASQRAFDLSTALFKGGASSYLDVLVNQRALYASQQTAISLRLLEEINRVDLYRALGGGSKLKDVIRGKGEGGGSGGGGGQGGKGSRGGGGGGGGRGERGGGGGAREGAGGRGDRGWSGERTGTGYQKKKKDQNNPGPGRGGRPANAGIHRHRARRTGSGLGFRRSDRPSEQLAHVEQREHAPAPLERCPPRSNAPASSAPASRSCPRTNTAGTSAISMPRVVPATTATRSL